jgi:DNA-binding CsgD family transcriptional regulator
MNSLISHRRKTMRPLIIDEFIEASNLTSSVDELFSLYQKAMAELGFDRLIFSLMTEHLFIKKPAGHGIMLNYPESWMKHYIENKFEKADPVRHKMYASPGAFFWKNLPQEQHLTTTQSACLFGGTEAGLHDGIGVPMRGPHGAIAGIGAASSSGGVDLNSTTLSYANLLSHQFYTVFLSLETLPDEDAPVYLSDREREVLYWCAQGKTRGEISDIIFLSESTIKFHIGNILRKLEAPNTTLAAFKALRKGLIQL